MACRTVMAGPGVTAIFCGSRARRPKCSVPGCNNPAEIACDYQIKRRKPGASQTCDAKLCDGCRVNQGGEVDYCPAHDRLAKRLAEKRP